MTLMCQKKKFPPLSRTCDTWKFLVAPSPHTRCVRREVVNSGADSDKPDTMEIALMLQLESWESLTRLQTKGLPTKAFYCMKRELMKYLKSLVACLASQLGRERKESRVCDNYNWNFPPTISGGKAFDFQRSFRFQFLSSVIVITNFLFFATATAALLLASTRHAGELQTYHSQSATAECWRIIK